MYVYALAWLGCSARLGALLSALLCSKKMCFSLTRIYAPMALSIYSGLKDQKLDLTRTQPDGSDRTFYATPQSGRICPDLLRNQRLWFYFL